MEPASERGKNIRGIRRINNHDIVSACGMTTQNATLLPKKEKPTHEGDKKARRKTIMQQEQRVCREMKIGKEDDETEKPGGEVQIPHLLQPRSKIRSIEPVM